MECRRLTDEEKDFIYKNREKLTVMEIARKLNRSYDSINVFMKRKNICRLLKSTRTYPYSLSERELEVLGLMAQGFSNEEIVEKLVIAQTTLRTHTNKIYEKLGLSEYKNKSSVLRVRAVLMYQEMVKEGLV